MRSIYVREKDAEALVAHNKMRKHETHALAPRPPAHTQLHKLPLRMRRRDKTRQQRRRGLRAVPPQREVRQRDGEREVHPVEAREVDLLRRELGGGPVGVVGHDEWGHLDGWSCVGWR